ncbi:MAG: aldehyde dehydrogenase family protein [Flavobacteriales bacterium]|nr:aldehyde dehydrogenase family protein [Flavobacteriales bacterium]|tara:strand:+ start:12972 stop:14372 length:1401 start_codon:yes stop_codon:yes gene_type:complete
MNNLIEIAQKQRAYSKVLAKKPLEYRLQKLQNLREALKGEWQHKLAQAMKADFNKGEVEVRLTEILPTLDNIKILRSNLKKWIRPTKVKTPIMLLGSTSYTEVQPKGNVLIISPWNYPIFLTLQPLTNAIAAGNTVIMKPSEHTPETSRVMAELIRSIFSEEEAYVALGGVELAKELLDIRFDHIFFTGSTAVGQIVMTAASKHLTSVTLELGGKSPTIVDNSANAYAAGQRIAWAKFTNAGQICIAPDHVYVHNSKLEDFKKGVVETIQRFYGEHPMKSDDFVQIVNTNHWERLSSMLGESIKEKGELIIGGNASRELRKIEPTVIVDPPKQGALMREEIFGPILPVFTFNELDQPLDEISNREHPLVVYIYSHNKKNIRRIQNNTRAGATAVNMSLIQVANNYLPFGGVGHSGMGRTNGESGFLEFSNTRAVYYQWGLPVNKVLSAPYTQKKLRIVQFIIDKLL